MASTTRLTAPPEAADPEPQVRAVMTPDVVAVTADADLIVAARVMAARRVRHLPVMDGGRCCGMLLEVDVVYALGLADNPLVRPPVLAGELCRAVPVAAPGAARSAAARLMRDGEVDAVLVCEGTSVVGILTATDLVRSLAADQ